MDSRLLNVFHDDPFDGTYAQVNTDFWPNESDTMGQLTETLNGILPIPADAELDAGVYTSTLLATEDDFRIGNNYDATTHLQNKEMLIYDDFTQHQLAADGTIEIITVNPNSLDSDSDDNSEDYEDYDDDAVDLQEAEKHDGNINMEYIEFDHDDNRSQYSNATFRTRTDSSSIGDYESHTSDYDDSSEEDDENVNTVNNISLTDLNNAHKRESHMLTPDEIPDLTAGLLAADGIDLGAGFELPLEDIAAGASKMRTISTNTIGSELDVNNFDLAEFITNDNFKLNTAGVKEKNKNLTKPKIAVPTKRLTIPVKSKINTDDSDSDADSDVIVDIETIDVDVAQTLRKNPMERVEISTENDVSFEDNVKKDPSWNPKATKKQENVVKETKTRPSTTSSTSNAPNPTNNTDKARNFSIVPSKRQCDILKGKANVGKNKLTTKQTQGKLLTKKGPETTAGNAPKAGSLTCRVGVGQGGKNLDLVTKNNNADEGGDNKKQKYEKDEKKLNIPAPTANEAKPTSNKIQVILKENVKGKSFDEAKVAVKRKLNLEEYKQRRGATPTNVQNIGTKADTENTNKSPLQNVQCVKHSDVVTSVVQSLRNQTQQKPPTDPITEAKNKVLRMQELKRAQQLKIIDSTISAKVPRVTKLPPLKEIVKDTYYENNNEQSHNVTTSSKLHPDYEELIIVSAGNNTEISIPPQNILPINTCERSLLKSSALLYKLPNNVLSSNRSLISSIQGVVVQNVIGPEKTNVTNGAKKPITAKKQNTTEQHGEDKIIMHLRKDRIRPRSVSIAIQTDLQPGFEPLPKIQIPFKKRAKRNYRKHKDTLDNSDSDASCGQRSRQRSRSPNDRSRSRSAGSYASSMERAGARQSDKLNCGYTSSRGSRRHRSSISSSYSESGRMSRNTKRQRRTSYTKRTRRYSRNSSSSSSSSSSGSDYSNRSRSRSCSRSRSRSSRSRNRNRSRSRSPYYRRSYSRSRSRSRSFSRGAANNRFRKPGGHKKFTNNISQPAVEERRIVYVGRIEEETTKEMLRRKFLPYGTIKQISIHYKDTGMKYGFVTYERSQDAFTVIDTSARDPTINMYDISFGGRRAFCRSTYADLDNAGINTYHSIVFPKVEAPPKEEDSFEALLQKVKAKMNAKNANKSNTAGTNTTKT